MPPTERPTDASSGLPDDDPFWNKTGVFPEPDGEAMFLDPAKTPMRSYTRVQTKTSEKIVAGPERFSNFSWRE